MCTMRAWLLGMVVGLVGCGSTELAVFQEARQEISAPPVVLPPDGVWPTGIQWVTSGGQRCGHAALMTKAAFAPIAARYLSVGCQWAPWNTESQQLIDCAMTCQATGTCIDPGPECTYDTGRIRPCWCVWP